MSNEITRKGLIIATTGLRVSPPAVLYKQTSIGSVLDTEKIGLDDSSPSTVVIRWWVLPLTAFLVLTFGSANLLLLQWMWRQDVYLDKTCHVEGCPMGKFTASFFAQFINSAAQMLCMGLFYVDKFLANLRGRKVGLLEYDATPSKDRPEPKCYVWIIPAVLDFSASMLVLYALSIEQASTVQVLRTFAVVFCALMSVTYLRRDLKLYQWVGVLVLTLGLLITCWDALFSKSQPSEEPAGSRLRWLAWSAVLLSTIVNMFQLVYEERVTAVYRCSPFKAVGWIGSFELFIVTIAMCIAHLSTYERMDLIWWQVSQTPHLQYAIAAICVSVAGFMALSLAVTKMGAALLTASINALRQVPIWAAELLLGWYRFDGIALIGMAITVSGFLLYNQLICTCGMNLDKTVKIRCSCHDLNEEYEEETSSASEEEEEEAYSDGEPAGEESEESSSVYIPKSRRLQSTDESTTEGTHQTVIIIKRSDEWVVETT